MNERERLIRRWFEMWLQGNCSGIEDLFSENCVYVESWGPKYVGVDKLRYWFADWTSRARVLKWDIKQFFHSCNQTAVEWYFEYRMNSDSADGFDGMTVIEWTEDNKIRYLKEFCCKLPNYDPYVDIRME